MEDLRQRDPYLVLLDFRAYAACQERAAQAWLDRRAWARSSILNTARAGGFSADRAVREYARDVWRVAPVVVAATAGGD